MATTPDAPAAVFAEGSSKAITVRWLPSFGATSYNLLRSTTSGGGYAAIASNLSTATTSYVDTSAVAGTTYYYVVQAVNSAGTSGNSPQFYSLTNGVTFTNTGSWATWTDLTLGLTLHAGTNTIQLTSSGQDGGNVDYLSVQPA